VGYHVSLAEDGATALARIQIDNPDLITLDVKLPDMTGIEVLSELRNRNVHVPVVVITAFGVVDDAVRSLKLGAYDFIENRSISRSSRTPSGTPSRRGGFARRSPVRRRSSAASSASTASSAFRSISGRSAT